MANKNHPEIRGNREDYQHLFRGRQTGPSSPRPEQRELDFFRRSFAESVKPPEKRQKRNEDLPPTTSAGLYDKVTSLKFIEECILHSQRILEYIQRKIAETNDPTLGEVPFHEREKRFIQDIEELEKRKSQLLLEDLDNVDSVLALIPALLEEMSTNALKEKTLSAKTQRNSRQKEGDTESSLSKKQAHVLRMKEAIELRVIREKISTNQENLDIIRRKLAQLGVPPEEILAFTESKQVE